MRIVTSSLRSGLSSLLRYKAQFYVESEVTQALYFGAAIFFWMVFVFSLTLICFGMMQRKHLQHVSADYPEIDLRTGRKGKFLLGSFILALLGTAGGFGFGGFGVYYMESRCVRARVASFSTMYAVHNDNLFFVSHRCLLSVAACVFFFRGCVLSCTHAGWTPR